MIDIHNFSIRWCLKADISSVAHYDSQAFNECWTHSQWYDCLLRKDCVTLIIESGINCGLYQFGGAMLYQLHKSELEILRMYIVPELQKNGLGTMFINRLKNKLSKHRRVLFANINEYDLSNQQWFSRRGFWATPKGNNIRFDYIVENPILQHTSIA